VLNEKQRKFVNNYLKTGNAKQSYIKAGYTATGQAVEANASRLLSNDKVRQELEKRQKTSNKRVDISLDWWKAKMKALADATILDFMDITANGIALKDLSTVDIDKIAAISDIEEFISDSGKGKQKIKMINKNQTMEMLGKHLGAYEKDNTQQAKPTMIIKKFDSDDEVILSMGDDE